MSTRTTRQSVFALAAAILVAGCDQMGGVGPEKPVVPPPVEKAPEVFKIPVGESAARGGGAPKVTIVAFSEFQCPFCARVLPTLDELARTHGDDLRIVFKHRPLPLHEHALPAALAAEAAREQGRFWPMHDRLFQGQQALDAASLEKYAAEIGLDVPRWKAAMVDGRVKARVEADMKLADRFGVGGTPSFFINGRLLVGAQPLERFKSVVAEEIARADQKLAAGVSRSDLYGALIKVGLDRRDQPAGPPRAAGPGGLACRGGACPGAAPRGALEVDDRIYKVEVGGAPTRGPRDAPVTIALFSEFQCPFCKRIAPTLEALEKEFPGKLRVVWKNFPLEFHPLARGAALAAHAAGQQGRFWPMHDRLLENQQALQPENLEKYAQEIGLDVAQWRTAMASPAIGQLVDADLKQGQTLGVDGTPCLFINGRKVQGALPIGTLRPLVEEELARTARR